MNGLRSGQECISGKRPPLLLRTLGGSCLRCCRGRGSRLGGLCRIRFAGISTDQVHEVVRLCRALGLFSLSASMYQLVTVARTWEASHPLPNFALNAASLPASSSSTFSSFCELGFHSGVLRVSLVALYTGMGDVVR